MFSIFRPHPAASGIVFLMLVFLEIAVFVLVGDVIGVFGTLACLILAMIAGFALLRQQGVHMMNAIQADMAAGRSPKRKIAEGTMLMFAAVLLIIPGFIGDLVAIMLLFPPTRALLWLFMSRFIREPAINPQRTAENRESKTIDLDAEEFHSAHPEHSPWRKMDRH